MHIYTYTYIYTCISLEKFTGGALEVPGASEPRVSLDPSIPRFLGPSIPRFLASLDSSISRSLDSLIPRCRIDKSRSTRVPGRVRDAIFDDFGSNLDDFRSTLGSIFVVFRGNVARVMRLAARIAEPLILPTGAVLWRVHRLYEKPENRKTIDGNSRWQRFAKEPCRKTRFLYPGARLSIDFDGPEALPGALWHSSWHPVPLSGTLQAVPGRAGELREASKTLLGCFPNALGRHRAS